VVCACGAITRARACGMCRCGPHKCKPRFINPARARGTAISGAAARHRVPVQAADLGVVFPDLGRCGRCLVGGALAHVFSRALLQAEACSRSDL